MTAAELVALIVAAFFIIGIGVGAIAVLAMAATRQDRIDRTYPDTGSYDNDDEELQD